MREEKAETLITEHDRHIPRRQAVVRPGRRGVTMSIDPYNDVEIYEVDIEDKIVEVITLTDTPKREVILPRRLVLPLLNHLFQSLPLQKKKK